MFFGSYPQRSPRRRCGASRHTRPRRGGATTVELAFVLPVFGLFLTGIMELNHAAMTEETIQAACQAGARMGVAETVTTAEVTAKVRDILKTTLPSAKPTIYVKDGSSFDKGTSVKSSDIKNLSNLELKNAAARQLFIVRAEVKYSDVSLIPPFFVKKSNGDAGTLSGQAVMRHE